MGGENRVLVALPRCERGSSPRGRGKLRLDTLRRRTGGLIPAWAGKTHISSTSIMRAKGSSPRGRGKLGDEVGPLEVDGLIPAWAGKTLRWTGRASCAWAHPRVGGENRAATNTRLRQCGSSPRGRGKRHNGPMTTPTDRLIPAWAGKTMISHAPTSLPGAHPRVGGENNPTDTMGVFRSGSSPRGRGKPDRRLVLRYNGGLIPAWAGKTTQPTPWGSSGPAHPRVGGENLTGGWCCDTMVGSSPRGRGKLLSDGFLPD